MGENPPARLLLIEDDPDQRVLLAQLITSSGIQVQMTDSVAHATELLRHATFDVVVTDFSLPDGFATELAERGLLDLSKTIVVSGHGAAEVALEATFFPKPIDIDEFIKEVHARMRPAGLPHASSSALVLPAEGRPTGADVDVDLVLYLSGSNASSRTGRANLEAILDEFDRTKVRIEFVDLSKEGAQVDPEDRVVFTPTLVRRHPAPRAWVVGDLSERAPVVRLLEASGLARKH